MKRLILISTSLIISTASFAQSACGSNNALFKFDNSGEPKEVHTLGTSPEFPFLRNKATAEQVYSALKRNDEKNTRGMDHLNELLTATGFENGAKDVKASDITAYYLPSGTVGNMGSGDFNNGYYRLSGDASEFKAWKISSSTGCYMYILAKCGNAFYPKTESRTACITTPVTLSGDMREVTLNSGGQKINTSDNTYIYYHRKRHKKNESANSVPEIADTYPSKPLLLRTTHDAEVVPETYKVTVSTPENSVMVCPDSVLNLTANINVEKTSEYTGNYPDKTKKQYKEVSRRAYKRTARKMRKTERKESKIARLTGVNPNV